MNSVEYKEPLEIKWAYGINPNTGMHDIGDKTNNIVAYATSNICVLYDYNNKNQKILRGHIEDITSIAVSFDKKWMASSDNSKDCISLIVWDINSCEPVRLINPNFLGRIQCVTFSKNAKFLAAVSSSIPQKIAIWEWTLNQEEPNYQIELPDDISLQTYICFCSNNETYLISNGDTRVVFYNIKNSNLYYYSPLLTDEDFRTVVGRFSNSIFLEDSISAITATSAGLLVLWRKYKNNKGDLVESNIIKYAEKLINLQESAINCLVEIDSFFATGDSNGQIKFYDQNFRIVFWYRNLHLKSIQFISFCKERLPYITPDKNDTITNAISENTGLDTLPILVGTHQGVYIKFWNDGRDSKVILRETKGGIACVAIHHNKPLIAIGGNSGLLKLCDYDLKIDVATRKFPRNLKLKCCSFDSEGNFLAIGFNCGKIQILSAFSLHDTVYQLPQIIQVEITKLLFSPDSSFLVAADSSHSVTAFKMTPIGNDIKFDLIARCRAHYKNIIDIKFLPSNFPADLVTLGEDKRLVFYILDESMSESCNSDNIRIIEQLATPTCFTISPSFSEESFYISANNQYKIKLYNTKTLMCRKTVIGPLYNSPLQKMLVLPWKNEDRYCILFINKTHIGLQMVPLDGNPHSSIANMAHSSGIADVVISGDLKTIFTAGSKDGSVFMWKANPEILDGIYKENMVGVEPYLSLLPDGKSGIVYKTLEDNFIYCIIRSMGMQIKERRDLPDYIHLEEIPYFMRAIGFYPTEEEIENMLNEVRFSNYHSSRKLTDRIEFVDLLKLYLNHRNLKNEEELVKNALNYLSQNDLSLLINKIKTYGEKMLDVELEMINNQIREIYKKISGVISFEDFVNYITN